jgi:DNA-directed RNA polymerase subunit beta'
MGHIELAAPVSHIWYFKGIPVVWDLVLDISPRALEEVIYFASYVVIDQVILHLKRNNFLQKLNIVKKSKIW